MSLPILPFHSKKVETKLVIESLWVFLEMEANNGMFPSQFPCLTKDNYESWFSHMKMLLKSQYAGDIVKNGHCKPKNEATLSPNEKEAMTKLKKNDQQALFHRSRFGWCDVSRRWTIHPLQKKHRESYKNLSKEWIKWRRCDFKFYMVNLKLCTCRNLHHFWITIQGCWPMLVKWIGMEKVLQMIAWRIRIFCSNSKIWLCYFHF